MSTEFIVRGSHSFFQRPERGTVRASVGLQGPAAPAVYDGVVAGLESVKQSVGALHDPDRGPVTWWSTQAVRTWADRPWNQDGKQLPLVHHARVGIEVKFRDFVELGRWVGAQVADLKGFRLDGVTWALTESNRFDLERSVRARAVQDAARRAQEYSDALGLGPGRPLATADAGMLAEGIGPHGGGTAVAFQRGAAGSSPEGSGLELVPADIELSAAVDARFVAG